MLRRMFPSWYAKTSQESAPPALPAQPAASQTTTEEDEEFTFLTMEKEGEQETPLAVVQNDQDEKAAPLAVLSAPFVQKVESGAALGTPLEDEADQDDDEEEDDDDEQQRQETTPLLSTSFRVTPESPATPYLRQYPFTAGVAYGSFFACFGVALLKLPIYIHLPGAALMSAVSCEILLNEAEALDEAVKKEQARQEMLFSSISAAVTADLLQLLFLHTIGFGWAAPVLMFGAKKLAPHVERELTCVSEKLSQCVAFAANPSGWWHRNPLSPRTAQPDVSQQRMEEGVPQPSQHFS